jgi:two-component system, NarL family, nitrate/nitrite response regulator NarL
MARLVIADDHELFVVALERLLRDEPDFDVVGVARSADELVSVVLAVRPDVLLLDVAMPDASGLTALPRLPPLQGLSVILLTAGIDESERALAFRLGVRAIIEKGAPSKTLFEAIRTVAAGQYYRAPSSPAAAESQADQTLRERLTSREREVLRAVAAGYSNREVAERLSISEDTVKHHLTKLFDKTGTSTRVELAMFAVHHRLIAT